MNHEEPRAEGLLYAEEVFAIQGAVYEVNRHMGVGFLEAVYQECLAIEFSRRSVDFIAQPSVRLSYKSVELKQKYSPDFICYGKIIVEIKAVRELAPEHSAQMLNYLKATNLRLGLLINFNAAPRARILRLIL